MTVQYKVIFVVILLGRETLKMKLKLFSIVESIMIDVTTIETTPMAVSPADACKNSFK